MSEPARVEYVRSLGLFSATMVVVGGIIGAGIFLNPAIVAQRTGTSGLTLAVWALGGAIALAGAFIFGELGQRKPAAGGGYVYLRDAFGSLPAFLYAWALLLVIATGAIAAVAVTFASYAAPMLGLPDSSRRALAVGAIVVLSGINYLGVKPGAITQNIFTVLKLVALAALVVAGLMLAGSGGGMPAGDTTGRGGLIVIIGTALVPVLFAFGGWQQANFIAEEVIDAPRTLPRALVLGVVIVVAVYVLANYTYLRVLGPGGLAASPAPASDTMASLMGEVGRRGIAAGIALSTFGFLNLVILVSPRVYQAMASDGLFFPQFARLHRRFRTPTVAIVFQGVWGALLVYSGTYGQLLDYVVFGDWIFFGLTAATLFVFRRRDGGAVPPGEAFRMPLYPWLLILFLMAAVYVVVGSIVSNPGNALRGTLLLGIGVPVYLMWRRRSRSAVRPAGDPPGHQ